MRRITFTKAELDVLLTAVGNFTDDIGEYTTQSLSDKKTKEGREREGDKADETLRSAHIKLSKAFMSYKKKRGE